MRKSFWLALILLALVSCQPQASPRVTILADGKTYTLTTSERDPSKLLAEVELTLGEDDRLLYLGSTHPVVGALPDVKNTFLEVRRAVALTLVQPDGRQTFETSAATVGQALAENSIQLYAADRLDPPAGTPVTGPLTVNYTPSRPLSISVDGKSVTIRSSAATVGQALAEAGLPLVGLDVSQPAESAPLPADGRIRVVRVVENVSLTQRALPFKNYTEPSADLDLDTQTLLVGGVPGLAISRVRVRSEDGVEVSHQTESETVVRPPQDRVVGYGTRVNIRTLTTADGGTIQYWRVMRLFATSYSPCRLGLPYPACHSITASGLIAQRGVVALVRSWYYQMQGQAVYIPGYGQAVVGDVGGGCPRAAAALGCPYTGHTWIDLAYSDDDWVGWFGWVTVYFLTPVPANIPYILP